MHIETINKQVQSATGQSVHGLRLLREKAGVYVYHCVYDGLPAIAKYFEHTGDRREIHNYRLLTAHCVPTIPTYVLGESVIVMEDIGASETWRLGVAEDMADPLVGEALAHWYFALHEAGEKLPQLQSLYFEYDAITRENLEALREKLPGAQALFTCLLERLDALQALIRQPACTLTYNDFYWTNFIVRKDKQAALMFDYNLLGRGWRYGDFRNLRSLSDAAYQAFTRQYRRLYADRHGPEKTLDTQMEKRIDAVAAPLFELISAFAQDTFPGWAEETRQAALDGTLLDAAQALLL